ncbi:MAG: MFS transporter, partial [Chloroflexota bacterium]
LLELGQSGGDTVVSPWLLLVGAFVLLALFLWQETRAPAPVLPLPLFAIPVLAASYGIGLLLGAVLIGLNSYVPPFVQGVLGGSALNAGLALAPMSLGWPLGSTISGNLILRFGYRPVVIMGMTFTLVGSLLMPFVGLDSSQGMVMVAMGVVGLGMGFGATASLIAVQSAVGWAQRGTATAFVQFCRSIGGALGVATMGALLNRALAEGLEGEGATGAASAVLDPAARSALSPQALLALRLALDGALHWVYVAIAVVAALGMAMAWFFPHGSVEEHAHKAGARQPEA